METFTIMLMVMYKAMQHWYPAVLASSVDLHTAPIVGVFQQAAIFKEQAGTVTKPLALVLMILLQQLFHQLQETLRFTRVPRHQVLPEERKRVGVSILSQKKKKRVDWETRNI